RATRSADCWSKPTPWRLPMPDDLDDPILAYVRAARPAPPPSLAAKLAARLPVRARLPRAALAWGALTAAAALVVAVITAFPRPGGGIDRIAAKATPARRCSSRSMRPAARLRS